MSNPTKQPEPAAPGSIHCLFEIDPETGEATGTVMPLCSPACLETAKQTLPGWRAGESPANAFGYQPQCEECGKEIEAP